MTSQHQRFGGFWTRVYVQPFDRLASALLLCLTLVGCAEKKADQGAHGNVRPVNEPQDSGQAGVNPLSPEWFSDEGYGSGKWGMSFLELKAIVPQTRQVNTKDGVALAHEDMIGGRRVVITYWFGKAKLYAATVEFRVEHEWFRGFMKDFRDVRQLLTDKYGHPSKEIEDWSGHEKAKEAYHAGKGAMIRKDWLTGEDVAGGALGMAWLKLRTEWTTSGTLVIQAMHANVRHDRFGDAYSVCCEHKITYLSRDLEPLVHVEQKSDREKL